MGHKTYAKVKQALAIADDDHMDTAEWELAMGSIAEPPVSEVVVRCGGLTGGTAAPGERLLHVLEASTPEQRRLGLMFRHRSELQQDGMLFRYPSDVTAAFTMANTWMPLRIYWFDSEGACVGHADLEAMSSREVRSPRPFRYALEIPLDHVHTLGVSPHLIVR